MSRCARLPRLNHQTKAELSPDLCRTIDVALKALRKASRQIQLTSVPTAYELQFLERIYYKNKNVQRPTMAWRKVIELRRVGYRWKEVDLVTVVDSFRLTFYDVTATTVPGSVKYCLSTILAFDLFKKRLIGRSRYKTLGLVHRL